MLGHDLFKLIKLEVFPMNSEYVDMVESFDYIAEFFSETHDILKFVGKSEIRMKLMVALLDKPLSIRELNSRSLLSYSSISNNLDSLIENNLVVNEDNLFSLTNLGYICICSILDLRKSMMMVEDY